MILIIPTVKTAIIIADTADSTIIAHVFLFNFVFLATNFIIGSTINDITNAIKNGI